MVRRRLPPLWGQWPATVNGIVGVRVATRPTPLSRPRSARCSGISGPVMDYDGIKEMLDKQERGFEDVALPTRLNNHNK